MNFSHCTDISTIQRICLEPEMFDRISDDFTDVYQFQPTGHWIQCEQSGQILGLCKVHPTDNVVLTVHIHIPLEYRGPLSIEIARGFLDNIKQNSHKKYIKLAAKVPALYLDVCRFTEKMGFEREGVDRKSYLKHDVYHDRIIYGLLWDH